MYNFPYPKGSVWRKWDLQLQTILDDDYISIDQYYEDIKNNNAAEWQTYIAKVGGEENALLYDSKAYFYNPQIDKKTRCLNYVQNLFSFIEVFKPDLECIGFTDHNYYDDCLLDIIIEHSKKSKCKAIPGVEINCQGIHMLLFFSEKLYGKETYSGGIHTFLTKCKIHNRKSGTSLTTTTADIKTIIDEVRLNDGIVIYPHCNSDNGLFQERTKTDRTHLADIFNHQKVNLLQSQNKQSYIQVEQYIKGNCNLRSKFCSHISSDARSLKDIGKPDRDNNYLWIKADPTFDGLKQIMYEFEQRIFVGPQKPEEKKAYYVIDNARFLDNTNYSKFSPDAIEINHNLTTIIGGKSTGKSLLLYYLAKTIDKKEVENRTAINGLALTYNFDQDFGFNFEVTWNDGQRTLLNPPAGNIGDELPERKILYIPQKYLNTLSESNNIKNRSALNEFILNIILQNPAISKLYQEALQKIKVEEKVITSLIVQIFSEREDIEILQEDLKKAGDEKGIRQYIKTLQEQADALKTRSGIPDEELTKYEDLIEQEKNINIRLSNLEEDKKTINNMCSALTAQLNDCKVITNDYEKYLNDSEILTQYKEEFKVIDSFEQSIIKATDTLISVIDLKIKELNLSLEKVKTELSPMLAKVQLQEELREKNEAIKNEQQKLNAISIKKNNLKIKKESYKTKTNKLIESYNTIAGQYDNLKNEFKKLENNFGDISLSVLVGFNEELFNSEVVGEYLNKKGLKRIFTEASWGEEFVYKYDPINHLTNISSVLQGLIDGNVNTIKGRSIKDAMGKLLANYFYLDFNILYKNDFFDKMSPGKKGLVLLQLLINLSNEEWPILLDQPEDDLDNRSVYEDLVGFLKTKKVQRQIIIVTHNPNLVVGADAEEVIVANQAGQEIERENKKYHFEYISSALENSFELTKQQEKSILYRKGIRQHVCEILEGGVEAFQKREQKYSLPIQ